MRFSRPFCFALLPLLASCQVFTDKPAEPLIEQTRMQGELSLNAGQLLFRPCQEQRQFILKEDSAAELSSDASTLFADGHATLYVDMRGQLQANAAQRLANQRLSAEVDDLRQGLEMVEERARADLGMVKPDEILVQYAPGR